MGFVCANTPGGLQKIAVCVFLLVPPGLVPAIAQHSAPEPQAKAAAGPAGVPVLLLSDLHFEPFADPARLPQLRKAPVEQWSVILSEPASATQAEDFAALQKACPVHGVDTPWALLSTSLRQAAAQQPRPAFVTVSGDLLSHEFPCRFRQLVPNATAEEVSAFSAKTIAFVSRELRVTFPHAPVYLTLGNNDSGCGDYREDPNSTFLQRVGETFAAAAHDSENKEAIQREFSSEGDYNVALPAPLQNARLIVLQNIFESGRYKGCSGAPVPGAEAAQLAWLRTQLANARGRHQHVWVMGHIPPGVDMYSTLSNKRDVCAGQPPVMFLSSEALADTLAAFPDVVALALFAHSHMDELRYLHGADPAAGIPVKLVSSISPVNGNRPGFTVAQVSPSTAELLDYTVFLIGKGASATREYSFRETYKLPDFSAASLRALTTGFLADITVSSPATLAYQRFFFPGDSGLHALGLQLYWRSYACTLRENKPEAYRACVCPVTHEPSR